MNMPFWKHRDEEEKAPLHYTGCGLDEVYLISGYEVVSTDYGEALRIKNLETLHGAIGGYLATQKKVLGGKELRFLRNQMDMTQSELGGYVGLSGQQVARWEKEESNISGAADLLLRALYLEQISGKKRILLTSLKEELESKDQSIEEQALVGGFTDDGWVIHAKAA